MLPVYCHMTNDLGACGGGGWTLVMKMNGTKVFTDLCTLWCKGVGRGGGGEAKLYRYVRC